MSQEELPSDLDNKGEPEKKRPVRHVLKIVSEALQIGYMETKSFLSELGEISKDHPLFSIILAAGLGIGGYQLYKNGDDDKEQNKEKTSLLDGLTEADFKKPWEIGCILCGETREKVEKLLEQKDPKGKKILLDILEKNLDSPFPTGSFPKNIDYHALADMCEHDKRYPAHCIEDIFEIIRMLGSHGVRGNETVDRILISGVEYSQNEIEERFLINLTRFNSTLLLHKYGSIDAIRHAMKRLSKKVNSKDEDSLFEWVAADNREIDIINLEILRNLNSLQAVKQIALDTKRPHEIRFRAMIDIDYGKTWKEDEIKTVFPVFKTLADDKDPGIREYAIMAIGKMFPESATHPLLKRMNEDESEKIRIYAAEVLNRIGDPRGRAFIADGLRDNKFKDPESAKEALADIDEEKKTADHLKK